MPLLLAASATYESNDAWINLSTSAFEVDGLKCFVGIHPSQAREEVDLCMLDMSTLTLLLLFQSYWRGLGNDIYGAGLFMCSKNIFRFMHPSVWG